MSDWNTADFSAQWAGWIPPADRDRNMRDADKRIMDAMPNVDDVFGGSSTSARPRIWQVVGEAIKRGLVPDKIIHPNGKHLKNITQIIGSCVGLSAGNMALYASLIDAMIRGQREKIMVPFAPYHYGRGRLYAGIPGHGGGSFGSAQAEALAKDGILAWDHGEGVPAPEFGEFIAWTEAIEYEWSNGAEIDDRFVKAGQKHLFPTAANVTSIEQAKTLLDSYYTLTLASNWGGRMRCRVQDGALLNEHAGTWQHQMWCSDYIDHPRMGPLFWIGNQWRYPHGKDPGGEWDDNYGAPRGGFYIGERDMDYIIRQREVFAFADPTGFVDRSRKFQWITAK